MKRTLSPLFMRMILFITLSFFLSCKEKVTTPVEKGVLVNIHVEDSLNNLTDKFLLSDVVQDLEIIPLETTKECLINRYWNISLGEKDIFINVYENILRFDRATGKFLNVIGRFGWGPTDVYYCRGIGVDDKNKLVYTLTGHNEIKVFSFDGKFKKTYPAAKNWAWMEAGVVQNVATKASRTHYYSYGKHFFHRMLPIQDGTKDLWQIGIMDTTGNYLMKIVDPACIAHEKILTDHELGSKNYEEIKMLKDYAISSESPVFNRYYNHINYLFENNDTIYRYSEAQGVFKPRYILHCGDRPSFNDMHKAVFDNDFYDYLFVTDVLETKNDLFLTACKDADAYLMRVDKETGAIRTIRQEGEFEYSSYWNVNFREVEPASFTNDISGGLPFYPFDQNENSWITIYDAWELLEKIDMDELKATETVNPEKKARFIQIMEKMLEDDNPVVIIATLK